MCTCNQLSSNCLLCAAQCCRIPRRTRGTDVIIAVIRNQSTEPQWAGTLFKTMFERRLAESLEKKMLVLLSCYLSLISAVLVWSWSGPPSVLVWSGCEYSTVSVGWFWCLCWTSQLLGTEALSQLWKPGSAAT